jgi:hypothetical protein
VTQKFWRFKENRPYLISVVSFSAGEHQRLLKSLTLNMTGLAEEDALPTKMA